VCGQPIINSLHEIVTLLSQKFAELRNALRINGTIRRSSFIEAIVKPVARSKPYIPFYHG
jgi:hypothetical protein